MVYDLKKRTKKARFVRNMRYLVLALPAVIYLFIFNYMPMFGVVLAFKNFKPRYGILGSPWVGFDNFSFFFRSIDCGRILRNTVLYNVAFIILGMAAAIFVALLLYEIKSKRALKYYQTTMILPYFISWVVVAYIGLILLSPTYGIINQVLAVFGVSKIAWYQDPKYWPFILVAFHIWKSVGMDSIIYYAQLMGVDESLYEAAQLDGANRFQQIIHVSIPSLIPVASILLIMSVGGIMGGDFGLFYQIPMDVGLLYPATDIIDTYVYRYMTHNNIGVSSAVGLLQAVVGLVMVLTANGIVRKVSYENRMF